MKNLFLSVLITVSLFTGNKLLAYTNNYEDSIKYAHKHNHEIILGFYPNPAKDKIFVETNTLEKPCKVYITDVVGNLVMERTCEKKKNEIILDELNSGVYYLTISQSGKSLNRRLVIER